MTLAAKPAEAPAETTETPAETPADTAPETPAAQTSDVGVFAALALLAVASGAAIVCKKRK